MRISKFASVTIGFFFIVAFLIVRQLAFAQEYKSNMDYKANYEKQIKTNHAIRQMIDKAVVKLKQSKVKKELIRNTFIPDIENYERLGDEAEKKAKAMAAKGDYKSANEWATMEWRDFAESLIKIHVAENSLESK